MVYEDRGTPLLLPRPPPPPSPYLNNSAKTLIPPLRPRQHLPPFNNSWPASLPRLMAEKTRAENEDGMNDSVLQDQLGPCGAAGDRSSGSGRWYAKEAAKDLPRRGNTDEGNAWKGDKLDACVPGLIKRLVRGHWPPHDCSLSPYTHTYTYIYTLSQPCRKIQPCIAV